MAAPASLLFIPSTKQLIDSTRCSAQVGFGPDYTWPTWVLPAVAHSTPIADITVLYVTIVDPAVSPLIPLIGQYIY